jgi:hypothetical protein
MQYYRVLFENNCAKTAAPLNRTWVNEDLADFRKDGMDVYINWYIVEAESEEDAIQIAADVVKSIWGGVLGLKQI